MKSPKIYYSALWMIGAIFAFSMTAIAGREATHALNDDAITISQLVFFRSAVGLLILSALIFLRPGKPLWVLDKPLLKLHFGRNSAHFLGQWCWFYGLSLLPLAQVFAIEFTVPIWTALFATLLLSEKITGRRGISIVLGFIGVLVILRPGFVTVPGAAWVVLAGAISYALSHTLTKRLTGQASALSILFYMHVMQLPLALILVVFDFAFPQGITWLYVVLTALAAMTAHFCMAKALSYGDAMVVMPMDFLRLPLIAVLGVILYDEGIDIWLLVGAGIMLFGNMLTLKEKPVAKKVD